MKYEIQGGNLPVVVCSLENGETMITESGAMSWMSPNIEMSTNSGGGVGKMFGRLFAGEHMFQNQYTARGQGMVAFSSSFPGSIRAVEITPGADVVVQKSAFLASEQGVELSTFFQKKMGTGLFGGEGFILQKLSGRGMAFLEMDGSCVEYELKAGQQIIISTGHLAMMDATCSMDVQSVKGVKNMLFGGEGLFNTVITGPGRVVLQTMPLNKFASQIVPYLPTQSSGD
ncbi:MAG: TIGR00266 family protein [Oscillospiraceae bacterium]|nr:TIGR00266 family protein [Oscillospiraceae bacterium]